MMDKKLKIVVMSGGDNRLTLYARVTCEYCGSSMDVYLQNGHSTLCPACLKHYELVLDYREITNREKRLIQEGVD